jgi:hypothetical protein
MKRTIFVLTIIALVIIGVSLSYQKAMASKADTCCQTFKVVDSLGNPVSGCVINVTPCSTPTCQCTTGSDGQCTICGLTTGGSYKASASCPTPHGGSADFTACATVVVTITVN